MNDIWAALGAAIMLITHADEGLMEIVFLSLRVSLGAVVISTLFGLPIGAALALFKFPGRKSLTILANALMGLPRWS